MNKNVNNKNKVKIEYKNDKNNKSKNVDKNNQDVKNKKNKTNNKKDKRKSMMIIIIRMGIKRMLRVTR